MVKKVKKVRSNDKIKVTHAELNELIAGINKMNLDMLGALQILAKDLDLVKSEIYDIHENLYLGPEEGSKQIDH